MTQALHKYFALLPVSYLLVTIFLVRGQVELVYAASFVAVILTFLAQYHLKTSDELFLARWMAVLSAIGLTASTILTIEKIELLSRPDYLASCSLSPIVACSPVITSPQASVFGFPNTIIGIFGFGVVLAAAMTLLAGRTKLNTTWWRTLLAGIAAAAGFCAWLFYQGVYDIGKLCLYCMLVWLVTYALLWLVTAHCIRNGHINLGQWANKILGYKYILISVTFLIIFLLLFFRWSDYWLSLI